MTRNASCRAITHYQLRVPFSDRVADRLFALPPVCTGVAPLGTIWAGPPPRPTALPLTSLLYHLDKHFSGLCRIAHFPQEWDARPMHAALRLEPQMESEAVDRGHLRVLRLNASKPFRDENERVLMVGVHVMHDVVLVLYQWIGLRLGILRSSHPSHHPEPSNVINVHYIHSVKEEIFEIDPVFAVWVTR